jgi:hypothetical protein
MTFLCSLNFKVLKDEISDDVETTEHTTTKWLLMIQKIKFQWDF